MCSERIELFDAKKNSFHAGKTATFERDLLVKQPVSVKIGHNKKGKKATWGLDHIVFTNGQTSEDFTFLFRQPIGEVCRTVLIC